MSLYSDTPSGDAQLHAEFYTFEGDGMWKGVPHVRIFVPGDKTLVNDRPASDYDKQRFQRQWLHYQMQNTEFQVVGTPLAQWRQERPEELTEGQMQELFILKFMSVEQVAMASDAQIMRVGMGAAGMRERARVYLNSKNAQTNGAALVTAQSEIDQLKALVAKLVANQGQQAAPAEPPVKIKLKNSGSWNRRKPKRSTPKKAYENVRNDAAAAGAESS